MQIIKSLLVLLLIAATSITKAQDIDISAGPEFMHSFNHHESFWGVGATAQAYIWVREPLGLGIKTGFISFSGTDTFTGVSRDVNYTAIPVLGIIRYPMPFMANLYGQDALGFTFPQNAVYENTGEKVPASFTYYFSLGYVIKDHFDISIKVGRSRFDKDNKKANVNEQNLGIRLAYIF